MGGSSSHIRVASVRARLCEESIQARWGQLLFSGPSQEADVRRLPIEPVILTPRAITRQEFEPAHPLANEEGFIYKPDIDVTQEMANMMSASRSFQSAIEVINTSKQLALRTLTLGK